MAETAEAPAQLSLIIGQIVLISADFRHREDVTSVPAAGAPTGGAVLQVKTQISEDGEAAVSVRVSSDPADPNALYQYAIEMMAAIKMPTPGAPLPSQTYLALAGTTFLYPFVREMLANLTMRARFGVIYLNPFNVSAADLEQAAATP